MEKKIDWHSLTFRLTPTNTMYVAKTAENGAWMEGQFLPFGPIALSPAAVVLNYGQGIFEGLKAFRMQNDEIGLFRPIENAKRFTQGAQRLCMPPVNETLFVEILHEIVKYNEEFVPPCDLGSLYIRPCLWGTSPMLGVAPASEYTFAVFCSPVGNYFKGGKITPVKFEVCDLYQRSAPLGVGHIKFIGNYAPTLMPLMDAKMRGFAGNIFLDSVQNEYVEETGIANIFCIKNKTLFTPPLSQSILSGVTRASIMELARDELKMAVVEEPITIKSLLAADECFCTGTAAVVTPIGAIHYQGNETVFQNFVTGKYTQMLYQSLVDIQLGKVKDSRGWMVKSVLEYAYTM